MKITTGIRKADLRDLLRQGARGVKRLGSDCSGTAFVLTALMLPLMLGTAALGLDASSWYVTKRQVQEIADAGAHAGAIERMSGASKADTRAAVLSLADKLGFEEGVDGTLFVNIPPASGPRAGDSAFVEVIVEKPGNVYFAGMIGNDSVTVRARAVSGSGLRGDNCVLSLDPATDKAIEFTSDAVSTFSCGVMANSTSDAAVDVAGTATLTSGNPVQAVGGVRESGLGEILYTQPGVQTRIGTNPVADPYAGLAVPAFDGYCAMNGDADGVIRIDGTVTSLSEGVYCGALTFASDAVVTLDPGVYVVRGGDFVVQSGARVTGNGVTVILTGADPADIGTVNIAGDAIVTLSAPDRDGHAWGDYVGEYAGILFFQDPNAAIGATNTFGGGASVTLSGAIYLPSQKASIDGSSSLGGCLQIVARQVRFSGLTEIGNDDAACGDLGVDRIGTEVARLFE